MAFVKPPALARAGSIETDIVILGDGTCMHVPRMQDSQGAAAAVKTDAGQHPGDREAQLLEDMQQDARRVRVK